MQDEAYVANVIPIYVAEPEMPVLTAFARHPWSKAQVARELGRSTRTVSRYMQQGLPYCKPWPECPPCFEPRAVRTWAALHGLATSSREWAIADEDERVPAPVPPENRATPENRAAVERALEAFYGGA